MALEALNKRDIGEIKSYAKPPVLVEVVLQAVMILRRSEPSWAEAKRQLGNPSFLKELIEYDRDNIPDDALDKVEKFVKKPDFQPEKVGKVSFAAKSLCMWVRAMHLYGKIYKKVRPKKERLRLAQEELDKLQKTLADLLAELEVLNAAIHRLEHEHEVLTKKKEEYAKKAKELALKLERAESIIESLSSEKERWQLKVSTLMEKKNYVVGDSFLASGYLTYLGPYDQSFRTNISNKWKTKVVSRFTYNPEFNLADFFSNESILDEWEMCPSDQYSHESAAIVSKSCYWSFVVDPEGQAVKWIKNAQSKKNLKIMDYQDPKWSHIVEMAVPGGFAVLIQNMSPELNPILESLLKIQKNQTVYFNKKSLKLNPSFHLYMSTKLPSPNFSPTIIKEIPIINFTIKQKGLEDQLLPIIVRNERPDLEVIKEKLVKSIRDCKVQFSKLEDKILELLRATGGSLLDDEVLVQSLQESKLLSHEVEIELSSNEKTEIRIDAARDEYRPCAKSSSILYFVLTDMAHVNPIYIFTLDSYLELFLHSIGESPRDADVSQRIEKINKFHRFAVYRFACRCILQKHSLVFVFHMCTQVLIHDAKLDREEYKFFIHGGQLSGQSNELINPCSQWLSQESWDQIGQLERLPKFLGITVSFDERPKLWYEWYLFPEPEHKLLPGNWRNICKEFQKLLIIRCLRPDRVRNCISDFISLHLGEKFLVYPNIHLEDIFKDASANKPLVLFTVSSDVDPEVIISKLANESNANYQMLSLGEGQNMAASQLIVDSIKSGDWAFLSNCHLLHCWLPTLEKIVSKLQTVNGNKNFRLWLSSSPIQTFPTSILQNSLVVSLDSPKGIQANMTKLYSKFTSESEIESCDLKFKCLLYSLSFFHSILLGRKHFQNLGWNGVYRFSYSDFMVSSGMLHFYLNEYKDAPWNALRTMIAEITYGGHLTDERDKDLMMDYYNQLICEEATSNIHFLLSPVGNYKMTVNEDIEAYFESIKSLPNWDMPEVFGQNSNAEIPCQMYDAEQLFKNMSKITKEDIIREDFNSQLKDMISELNSQLPPLLSEMATLEIVREQPEPFNYILVQETRHYNFLLNLVSNSLQNLEDALLGKQILTESLKKQVKIIQRMNVPGEWKKSYPSLKPLGSWMDDFKQRVNFFSNWISSGSLPIKVWLPAFINPKRFLNAALLSVAKSSDIMLKDLLWEYHVSTLDEKHIYDAPPEGIYVRGLLLEGAGWDKTNSLLTEPEPLKLIVLMPVILFKPVTESSIRGVYNCPCYYTSQRTDEEGNSSELFSIDLKTKKDNEYWKKRSISLLLSDDT